MDSNTNFYPTNPAQYDVTVGLYNQTTLYPDFVFSRNDPRILFAIIIAVIISVLAVAGNLLNLIFIYLLRIYKRLCETLCQLQGFILFAMYGASLSAVSVVSIDRCLAIVNPFGYQPNVNTRKSLVVQLYI
ncbi:hypothetical protein TrispH2_011936 [Trichoplax sp. H2]|nr:hypothetical protein TrispH2_011936 [Trichoplax sp. H2]|eukprot:RDD36313.1 hypothetical protein TrispH2_011936 [Trichoplax sp. H2]